MRLRVMVADDMTLFRMGLVRLLQSDPRVEVVAEAANGREAVELVRAESPDAVLMDVHMPVMSGVEATAVIKRERPDVRVLMLATFGPEPQVTGSLRAGADGYVLKDSTPEAIVFSLLAVVAGQRVMTSAIADLLLPSEPSPPSPAEVWRHLTRRELELLQLVADGLANKQIARRVGISEKTVRNHLSHVYEKLGVGDRAQAITRGVRSGVVHI